MAAIKRGGTSSANAAHELSQDRIDAKLISDVMELQNRVVVLETEIVDLADKRRKLLEFIAQFV